MRAIRQTAQASRIRQGGAALLVLVLLMLAGVSVFAMSFDEPLRTTPLQRQLNDIQALQEAKKLVLGASYASGSNNKIGILHSADADGDGSANNFEQAAGHFPWRQFGAMPSSHSALTGASREALWYFIDPAYYMENVSEPLNYETGPAGALSIDGVSDFVAIIVAGGEALNESQSTSRPSSNLADVAAYLEDENAFYANNNFVTTSAGAFNDRVIGITRDELFERAADFAALKFVGRLWKYANDSGGCDAYPRPADFSSAVADSPDANQWSLPSSNDADIIVGMPPIASSGVKPSNWSDCRETLDSNIDSFIRQDWFRFMRYARAPGGDGGVGCSPGNNCLVIQDLDGNVILDDVEALVIISGPALDALNQRWNSGPDEADFFEADNADDDSVFTQAQSSATFNDRLFIVTRSGG